MNSSEIEMRDVHVDSDYEGRKQVAIAALKRGTEREKIMERTGLSGAQLFQIEQDYYDSRQVLDDRAQTIKNMDRLESLLDLAWDHVERWGLANEKGDFGANLSAFLSVVREISELAGLKKQKTETTIKVVQEEQINLIVTYVAAVLDEYTDTLKPLLTAKGKKQLEAHRVEWYDAAVSAPTNVLEGTVDITE